MFEFEITNWHNFIWFCIVVYSAFGAVFGSVYHTKVENWREEVPCDYGIYFLCGPAVWVVLSIYWLCVFLHRKVIKKLPPIPDMYDLVDWVGKHCPFGKSSGKKALP